MRRAALLVALAFAACGGESGDLIAIEVSGGAEERPLRLVVTGDGRGTCNDGEQRQIPSERLIEAREVERELGDLAEEGANLGGRERGRRSYVVRTADGAVRWSEGQESRDEALGKAALLSLRLERELCTR